MKETKALNTSFKLWSRRGFIYALENPQDDTVKVGFSLKPQQRLSNLRASHGASGRVWVSPLQWDARTIELTAHRALADFWVYGEWFTLDFDSVVEECLKVLTPEPTEMELRVAKDLHGERVEALTSGLMDLVKPANGLHQSASDLHQSVQALTQSIEDFSQGYVKRMEERLAVQRAQLAQMEAEEATEQAAYGVSVSEHTARMAESEAADLVVQESIKALRTQLTQE